MTVGVPRGIELTAIYTAYKTLATRTPEPAVISENNLHRNRLNDGGAFDRVALDLPRYVRVAAAFVALVLLLTSAALPFPGRKKNTVQYGAGLIVNIPLSEPEVAQAVEEVAQNTIIRGTKEYNKDEYIAGAVAATSTPLFPAWKEGGKVFYKVRNQALDPRNFQDSSDVGTLAVRYVVKPQGDKNTILRIDALFVEDFRHSVHLSDGSVESSEYKDIQDKLGAVELIKQETAEALQAKDERLAKQNSGLGGESNKAPVEAGAATARISESTNGWSPVNAETTGQPATGAMSQASSTSQSPTSQSSAMPPPLPADEQSGESLEQHVAQLRRQLERRVKKPGAPLQSSPFHTASTLKSLEPGTEVLIMISTTYWYGVETREGEHGWIRRDELEQVP